MNAPESEHAPAQDHPAVGRSASVAERQKLAKLLGQLLAQQWLEARRQQAGAVLAHEAEPLPSS